MTSRRRLVEIGSLVRCVVQGWVEDDAFGVADEVNPHTLKGGCAIASLALHQVLEDVFGFDSTFVTVEVPDFMGLKCHCWVNLNEWTIDLTATQFDQALPDVLVVNSDDYDITRLDPDFDHHERAVFVGKAAFNRLTRWRQQQNAFTYSRRILDLVKNFDRDGSVLL